MEVIESRYGLDRSIEKLDYQTIRVMGESTFVRTSSNRKDDVTMYDFEGGPCLTLGGRIRYGGMNWKITEIKFAPMYNNLSGCLLSVIPIH